MVIQRLRGGVGNQLFQYAAGKALTLHHRVPFKIDPYYYTHHPYRTLVLDKFKTDYVRAPEQDITAFIGSTKVQRYFHKKTSYRYCREAFAQPYYHFYEEFFNLPSSVYLSGYWQSERYFEPYASVIREHLVPREPMSEKNTALKQRMQATQSVSVHVRHGDYQSAAYTGFFAIQPPAYYRRAINTLRERLDNPTFFFFSDDISWCKQTFADQQAVFVDHNSGEQAYWDLLMMANCQHHIIANSSFSWWGAWLNPRPDKLVIAPQQWFTTNHYSGKNPVYPERTYNLKDQLPNGWIRL